jgi:glucan phosphoethanolaminetransferase (alkaline phosphatase superfamily)
MFSPELARSLLSLPFLSLLCSSLLSFLLSFLFLLLCFYLPSYLLLRCCLHCFSWLADSLIHFYSKKNYFSLLSKTHKYIGQHDSAIFMIEVVFTVTILIISFLSLCLKLRVHNWYCQYFLTTRYNRVWLWISLANGRLVHRLLDGIGSQWQSTQRSPVPSGTEYPRLILTYNYSQTQLNQSELKRTTAYNK